MGGRKIEVAVMKRLTEQDRERLLTAIVYLVRTGTEIYSDYRSGDCVGAAKEIIGLAKNIKRYGRGLGKTKGKENE